MLQWRSATGIIAIVTVAVSALAILIDLDGFVLLGGFIPARLSGLVELPGALPTVLTPLSSALLHGGWVHLALNMVMLAIAGVQVERVIGGAGLTVAYVVGAVVAAAAQFAADPASAIPMVGASGAISALFGVFALFFGQVMQISANAKVNRALHVAWLLAAWVAIQVMTGMLAGGQGVLLAVPAHIGGFIAGLALAKPLLIWKYRGA